MGGLRKCCASIALLVVVIVNVFSSAASASATAGLRAPSTASNKSISTTVTLATSQIAVSTASTGAIGPNDFVRRAGTHFVITDPSNPDNCIPWYFSGKCMRT